MRTKTSLKGPRCKLSLSGSGQFLLILDYIINALKLTKTIKCKLGLYIVNIWSIYGNVQYLTVFLFQEGSDDGRPESREEGGPPVSAPPSRPSPSPRPRPSPSPTGSSSSRSMSPAISQPRYSYYS